jgi:phosphatidylglycerol:prolipoprotein diacylglycerol transferase
MIAFSIWPLDIHRYWIFYFVGFLWWYFFLRFLWKKKIFVNYKNLQNLLEHKLEDLLIAIILWVIIGWRLWHIIIYDIQYFIQNPLEMFAIRKWWMSFIWWMIWSFISIIILKQIQKLNNKEFRLLLDCAVTIVPLWILFGRIWNFLNQELYWIIVPENSRNLPKTITNTFKNLHIFHIYPKVDSQLRLNTNFLASIFEWFLNLTILLILTIRRIKTKIFKPGFLVWFFLVRYSTIRFILEYLRQDSQYEFIGLLSKSQWFFVIFFLFWVYLLTRHFFKKTKIKQT